MTTQPTMFTSCMNSRMQSTQEFWYRMLSIPLDYCGPWKL